MFLENKNYQWYAIYTRANSEKKVAEKLLQKNIECYLPTRTILKSWSDRKKKIDEPLFRCYLFVKVSYKEFFNALNIPGVVSFVTFGGKAQPIPENQINNIKTFMNQIEHEVILSYERIQKGVVVQIESGTLKGIKGEVINIFGQSRLMIRIDAMNCCLYANISKDEVRMIEEFNACINDYAAI